MIGKKKVQSIISVCELCRTRWDGFHSPVVKMENKGTDEMEKLKTKFMSAWHNVKYSKCMK